MKFRMKKGDLLPALPAQLLIDGVPQDLSGATVVFNMTPVGSTTPKVNRASAVVTDAVNGKVQYNWGGTDTDTTGQYNGEFEATIGGKKLTFPNDDDSPYIDIRITLDLA